MDILFPQVEVHLVQRIAFKRTLSLVGSLGTSIPDQVHNCNDEDNQEFPAIDFTSAPPDFQLYDSHLAIDIASQSRGNFQPGNGEVVCSRIIQRLVATTWTFANA